ncbi:unnamed protein product [Musa acuminata subsp. malaccensis]|uniref:(wild Malaysian banana) hypothetical protein n=1 Tax=Musa acuminata subsp. malaccensis TaxID=214687 RepID=A0A804IUA5_MUSAM|nr:PREDICTED: UDP-glycosyltransferase 73C1-like [Musa acuminata subsp. malaccensis]CAG1843492.1 unnamed protein product [Musa acuminata subsp. malaccensis]
MRHVDFKQNEASLRVGSLPGAGPWPHANTTILLAKHGAIVSFITAPINAARTDAVISQAKRVGLPTDFVEPPFPCTKVGVPEGCENVDLLPSMSSLQPFFTATSVLHQPLKQHFQAQRQAPGCMVADCCNPWMREFAKELRMPYLLFHGPSCLYVLCSHMVLQHKIYDRIDDPFEPFDVPGLLHWLEINLAHHAGLGKVPRGGSGGEDGC